MPARRKAEFDPKALFQNTLRIIASHNTSPWNAMCEYSCRLQVLTCAKCWILVCCLIPVTNDHYCLLSTDNVQGTMTDCPWLKGLLVHSHDSVLRLQSLGPCVLQDSTATQFALESSPAAKLHSRIWFPFFKTQLLSLMIAKKTG